MEIQDKIHTSPGQVELPKTVGTDNDPRLEIDVRRGVITRFRSWHEISVFQLSLLPDPFAQRVRRTIVTAYLERCQGLVIIRNSRGPGGEGPILT